MANIMVLEDLEDSYTIIQKALGSEHSITWAKTVSEAQKMYNDKHDIALVDVSLPDGDGYDFCYWVRGQAKNTKIPILFISAKTTVENRITGFTVGGDDYITKPVNIVELKLRVENKLKRLKTNSGSVLRVSGIEADTRSQRAKISEENVDMPLDLTPIEFKILYLFLNEPEKVFSRDELLNKIWGENIYVYPRSVDTHVSKLRKKLGHKSEMIKSIHGVGYRFSTNQN